MTAPDALVIHLDRYRDLRLSIDTAAPLLVHVQVLNPSGQRGQVYAKAPLALIWTERSKVLNGPALLLGYSALNGAASACTTAIRLPGDHAADQVRAWLTSAISYARTRSAA